MSLSCSFLVLLSLLLYFLLLDFSLLLFFPIHTFFLSFATKSFSRETAVVSSLGHLQAVFSSPLPLLDESQGDNWLPSSSFLFLTSSVFRCECKNSESSGAQGGDDSFIRETIQSSKQHTIS